MFWRIMMPPTSGPRGARSLPAWPWRWTYYVLEKTVHCSPNNTGITSRNAETLSKTSGRTHYIYSESKSCGFDPVLLYIHNVRIYSSIKMKFTSAMVVVFEYGLNKRTTNLWLASTKRALNALIPCRHPMSSGDLERLNSADTLLRRENDCTNFLLVP